MHLDQLVRFPWAGLRDRREVYRVAHSGLQVSDDEFVKSLGVVADSMQAMISVILRAVVAQDCDLPPTMISTSEPCIVLNSLMGAATPIGWLFGGPYGFSFDHVFFRTEHELGRRLSTTVTLPRSSMLEMRLFAQSKDLAVDATKTFGQWAASTTLEIESGLRGS